MESSGPNYPSTAVDDSGVGTVSWSSPGNVVADDGSVASRSATGTLLLVI